MSFRSAYVTKSFWLETADRAVKSAGHGVILGLGLGEGLNAFELDWMLVAGFAFGGAFISLLTSLISAQVRNHGTASMIETSNGG